MDAWSHTPAFRLHSTFLRASPRQLAPARAASDSSAPRPVPPRSSLALPRALMDARGPWRENKGIVHSSLRPAHPRRRTHKDASAQLARPLAALQQVQPLASSRLATSFRCSPSSVFTLFLDPVHASASKAFCSASRHPHRRSQDSRAVTAIDSHWIRIHAVQQLHLHSYSKAAPPTQ